MRTAPTVTAIGLLLWLTAPGAHALGFGSTVNATQLGQPLNFAANVRLDGDESLARECVSAEVMVGENRLQPNQVRVTLESGTDGNARSVRVTSTAIVDEPVVTVSVTLGCGARITRKFVAFVDPPLVNMAQAQTPTLPPQRIDSQVAPLADIVQGSNAPAPAAQPVPRTERAADARPPRPRASGSTARAARPAAQASVTPPVDTGERRPGRANRMAAAPRPTQTGPRLRLEAAPPAVARAASAPASAAGSTPPAAGAGPNTAPGSLAATGPEATSAALLAAAASAASAADEAGAQLAKERQRLQALEDSMNRLRADSQATQQTLAAMQARLNQAESERYANPLVYALAWLSALLAVAVAAMWWRQSRQRASGQWWSSANAPSEAAEAARARASLLRDPVSTPQVFPTGPDVAGAYEPISVSPQLSPPTMTPPTAPAPLVAQIAPQHEPARELSVEELIDLEQQAEFFIVLGQDDAAIELLMSHVRSDGGSSPLPYLKLLEIYRRRGEVDAYQRIRERFNRRFNAYAPDWHSDLQQGRSLEDYPAVIQQLMSLWSGPERTMECLDGLLFRRKQDDQTFDLPAYRELLFLYSIARDLAEQEASRPGADVDLLLPLDDGDDGPISQLMTTTTGPLDLTLSSPEHGHDSGFINLNDLDGRSGKSGKR